MKLPAQKYDQKLKRKWVMITHWYRKPDGMVHEVLGPVSAFPVEKLKGTANG